MRYHNSVRESGIETAALGEQTGYGSTLEASYLVAGFPLASYSDEAYEDPATQQRIKFLEALSDKGL